MNGQNKQEHLIISKYNQKSFFFPKFPTGEISSETEKEMVSSNTDCILSKPDKNSMSPYDELQSFTFESPEIELSPVEYVTDSQFESCSDSELGSPTPSVREPLSSEMFIATICESANAELDKDSTIKNKQLEENKENRKINASQKTQNGTFPLLQDQKSHSGENKSQVDSLEKSECKCEPMSNTSIYLQSNDIDQSHIDQSSTCIQTKENNNSTQINNMTYSSHSEKKSKVTEVRINLKSSILQSSPELSTENNSDHSKPNENSLNKSNNEIESSKFCHENRCNENEVKTNTEQDGNDNSKIDPANLFNATSENSTEKENKDGVNFRPDNSLVSPTLPIPLSPQSQATFRETTSMENNDLVLKGSIENVATTDNSMIMNIVQTVNAPSYKNVQEKIRNFEKGQSDIQVESNCDSFVLKNNSNNMESLRKMSLVGNTDNDNQNNISKCIDNSSDPEIVNTCNTQESNSQFTDIKTKETSIAPVPPPRASSKNVIPPPIPPFIEDDEEECVPPVPPLPATIIYSLRSCMTSPLPPQRQYLLIPIDHFNCKTGQNFFPSVPPSPPQRTTSYKKFIDMTPTHTNYHSPESLKES